MKTYLEICQYISQFVNAELKSNIVSLTDVTNEQKNAINRALRIVWLSENWRFRESYTSFNTVAGQKYYTWVNYIDTDGLIIDTTSLKYTESLRTEPDSSGTPEKYSKELNQLRLYPTPDSVKKVDVYYLTDKPVLASDDTLKYNFTLVSDVLNLPEYLEDIFLDCIGHLVNEILNADQTDEDYLEHKLRNTEAYRLLLKADSGTLDEFTGFIM